MFMMYKHQKILYLEIDLNLTSIALFLLQKSVTTLNGCRSWDDGEATLHKYKLHLQEKFQIFNNTKTVVA